MSGHTPGPWTMAQSPRRTDVVSADDVIAEVMSSREDADARLIAAAPQLLEALELAREQIGEMATRHVGPSCTALNEIDAAIAAATGGKP